MRPDHREMWQESVKWFTQTQLYDALKDTSIDVAGGLFGKPWDKDNTGVELTVRTVVEKGEEKETLAAAAAAAATVTDADADKNTAPDTASLDMVMM